MDKILNIFLTVPAILIGFTFHEYAHAKVADKLGDKTPRFQGRLTLNPSAHIDVMGLIMIFLFRFGWAKPVQTNPSAYKNYYKDDLKVSIAGPLANLGVALVFSIIYGLYIGLVVRNLYGILPAAFLEVLQVMIIFVIQINVNLFIFNLIPIPGLDGFHILRDLMPQKFYRIENELYKYQIIILFSIIFFGGKLIAVPSGLITNLFMRLSTIIFGMF
ncbi:site-2 protease family protein [Clostridium weizhouense]|uniref:Site-2 protease family protein n=1 Tax=Clostridium weizhouense TaxID=2859781 RepID=A0ABS7ARE1_9CLOT|nr:site-2 protease family protein [Clostridium weizhouense]MBW6411243.1 site-2 protease family protein [Clostridium weizhouense]